MAASRLLEATGHCEGERTHNLHRGGLTGLNLPKDTLRHIMQGQGRGDGLINQLIGWDQKFSGSFTIEAHDSRPRHAPKFQDNHAQAQFLKWRQSLSDSVMEGTLASL